MFRNLPKSILVLFSTLFVLFGVVEIAVRIFAPQSGRTFVADPFIRTIHEKNVSVRQEREDVVALSKTNKQGFMGDDFVVGKEENAFRIAVIGDSFTEAFEVGTNNSFTALLEKGLNEKNGLLSYETYNFGISGAGSTHELLAYEHYAKPYNPDMVIWQIYLGNDLSDDLLLIDEVKGAESPNATEARTGYLRAFFSNNFHSPRFFLRKIEKIKTIYSLLARYNIVSRNQHFYDNQDKQNTYPFIYDIFNSGEKTIFTDNLSLTCKFAKEFKEKTFRDGIPLLVVLIPAKYQVLEEDWGKLLSKFPGMQEKTWDRLQPLMPIKECLGEQKIDYIDMYPIFEKIVKDGGERMYFVTDDHFNVFGHQLTAEALKAKISGAGSERDK